MKKILLIFSLLLIPINIVFANSATEHGTNDIYEDLLHNRYYLAWYMNINDILPKYDLQLKSSEGSVSVYTLSSTQDEPSLTFYFDEDKLYTVSLYFNKQLNLQKQQYNNFSKYYVIKNGLNKILPLATVITSPDGNTITIDADSENSKGNTLTVYSKNLFGTVIDPGRYLAQPLGVGRGGKRGPGLVEQLAPAVELPQGEGGGGAALKGVDGHGQCRPRLEPFALGGRYVHHRAVARGERAARGGVLHESEVLQVAAAAELVVALRIAVVHQYVVVAAYQPEHARPLHRILARFLQVAELGGVRPCQLLGRGPHHPLPRAEAVVYRWQALVFEEKHILAVATVVDNVAVDGRRAEVEQQPWLGDVGEVVVDIAVE